ncbi:G-type lectin S-receptor-like serine/threonine-protein kinase At1g11300 isoform X2 [Amaranthus tricolor]|uniref:G-type lectin S-receptor-like serine/threonine-protein kinase At1g11300 isoform X2 n=1 Tax=Amaranthus tricolor TaxID=29722 RepID=UPI0025846EE6|nr:G-type lectin S-receptor-like serine/threonine-protein kinase At1g11300 isoform X2 [Amaranthus tricolor]
MALHILLSLIISTILLIPSCFFLKSVSATASITTTKFLRDPGTLASNNAVFKMGFFSPANSTNRYFGIWYDLKEFDATDVVWVANSNNPIKDSSGFLKVSNNGNLQLLNEQNVLFWSTNTSHQTNNSLVAHLLDTGNLVLVSTSTSMIIWQSFEHLTNSFLSQMTISINKDNIHEKSTVLRSWKNASDPSDGYFTLGIIPNTLLEFSIWDANKRYWRSGPWNGNLFIGVPSLTAEATFGFRIIQNVIEGTVEILFSVTDDTLIIYFFLNYDGNILLKNLEDDKSKWKIWWQSFQSECDVYGKCGAFGRCNPKDSPICKCIKGFEPKNIDEWRQGNWTNGCTRRTRLQCSSDNNGKNTRDKLDGFLLLKDTKVPDYAEFLLVDDENQCKMKCLGHCSCLAYAYPKGIGCMIWNGSLIDLQELSPDGTDIFIRLAHSELGERNSRILFIAIPVTVIATFFFGYYLWRWMRRRNDRKSSKQEMYSLDSVLNSINHKNLALFKFKQLEIATNGFTLENKLGQGGFGPVYKGILEGGQGIAVKRLSSASGQGLQEFMNEVLVISKLQHKNLVKLLGCCVEREEKILVYEFMPNKSLDALLFDSNNQKQLDWKTRFNIINGICRGLLYLHRDSRLKIIHRDLKASNILLDEDLNPKISDFGMARIFGTKQDQANTLRVVGTYGYMSPEYAMGGRFSEKSDIFSLGVLLLEIISGRKNRIVLEYEPCGLLIHAWKLWKENNMLSLIDSTVLDACFQDEILKCIQLGLLCVQEFPEDRPTISALITMLDVTDITDLPHPKQPGFTQRQACASDGLPHHGEEHFTLNHLSFTDVSGR